MSAGDDVRWLAEVPLGELLERFAARTAAPGGGSGAATACALAAALVEMAAAFDLVPQSAATAQRAAALRSRALELGELDLRAYAPVLEAFALAADDPERPHRIIAARSAAAEPPLAIACAAAEVATLGAELARHGNPHLTGDATTAVLIAEAACRAAVELVEANLDDGDDPRSREAWDWARRAAVARTQALSAVVPSGGPV
ncbi:MAG TPA: cyclodeaminase/cyclohydrolase family protein [Solirubrobacteraceae bacterium]|jgi:formiminotetrahydrofolate cyclodeaminase